MKESKYNIHVEYNGQKILFNSRTIATAQLDVPALDLLKTVNKGNEIDENDLVQEMKRVGILVEDSIDELQQLEMYHNLSKFQKNVLSLVIAPTMACNFSCPYCFENPKSGVMTANIQDEIISLIEKFATDGKKIDITWFGGEPLLAKNVIYRISEKIVNICKELKVEYNARIITNGYLLDEATVLKLKEYKINFIQLTLDGLPKTHNQRKQLKGNPNTPTFERIVESALLVRKHQIPIAIRFNVDKQNVGELEPLLKLIIEQGFGDSFYLGHVLGTSANRETSSNYLSAEEFARLSVEFEKLLFSNKIKTSYPMPMNLNCGACYLYAYVIEPDGGMYKCWNDIGLKEKCIGNVTEFDDDEGLAYNCNQNNVEYMNWTPFKYDKCRECKILPICMGGCQYNGMKEGIPVCDNWKYGLEEYIKLKCDA